MNSQTIFAKLRDALAHLYPTTESARRIADDAGLDARRIRFSPQALENWHAILGATVQADKLEALLHIVLAEYNSNGDLLAAYGMYRHFIEQGGQIAPPEPIYGDQGNSPSSGVQIGIGAKNVNIGQNITQTTIEGNVNTGGGDVVGRDKVTIGTIINNLFRGDSEEVRKLRNRQAMLKLVYDIWVKGVLENSLYNQLLIDLDMEQRPEAVERPWGMVLEKPTQDRRLLPTGTKIATVFAELNQSMLILGEPGSGKSTMLLELARDLLYQANQNPTLPMPVLFNLSSWANKRLTIRQWLVDELREKYQIPKALAQAWVDHDELLLLLDGLDEVKREYREECMKALNEFQQSRKQTVPPLALCSRTSEYEVLTSKLKLNGAIVIRPLTSQQIDMFLLRAGDKLSTVAHLLQHDTDIQTLVQSPLTFSILCLTYHDKKVVDIKLVKGIGTHLQQLFDAYIVQMFQHRGKLTVDPYPRSQTLHWLAWLAARMMQYAQTEFLIEHLQPDWMQIRERQGVSAQVIMFLWGPLYGLTYGLIYGLIGELVNGLINVHEDRWGALFVGLMLGSIIGLIGGFSDYWSGGLKRIRANEQFSVPRRRLQGSIHMGLFWFLVLGLSLGMLGGLTIGLFFGFIGGLIGCLVSVFKPAKLINQVPRTWQLLKRNLLFGLSIGLLEALLFGLIVGLLFGLPFEQGDLMFKLRFISQLLTVVLLNALIFGLIFEADTSPGNLNVIITHIPNQGVKRVISLSLNVGLAVGLMIGLCVSLVAPIQVGLISGLTGGLIGGLIGNGDILTKHLILRFFLYLRHYSPLNYARFLDYCADRIFLRKVGGGYIFVHRLLMEHFASLTEEDIKRLAAASDKR